MLPELRNLVDGGTFWWPPDVAQEIDATFQFGLEIERKTTTISTKSDRVPSAPQMQQHLASASMKKNAQVRGERQDLGPRRS